MASNALVVIDDHCPLDLALKKLKGQLLKSGTFKEIKKGTYHEKPSLKRRRKRAEARKKAKKRELQMRDAIARVDAKVEARKEFGRSVYVAPGGR